MASPSKTVLITDARGFTDLRLRQHLQAAGWRVAPSAANFLVAAGADGAGVEGRFGLNPLLTALRAQGIKLRDCASFGLPGRVRMAVVAPAVQDALMAALDDVTRKDMA